jgi:hypothetical protein
MSANCVSAEQLRAFFREPANFANRPVDELFAALGPSHQYDDWDWGRLVYDWRHPEACFRVVTQAGRVMSVYLLEFDDTSRFGTGIETVWERPAGAHLKP